MPPIDLDRATALLREFVRERRQPLSVLLIGGLALHHYGLSDRVTADLDAEVRGDIEALLGFLRARGLPADLGENISAWSVVAMPPGYRERSSAILTEPLLELRVLSPADFVIAKLRRFTEEDIRDALFVARKFNLVPAEIRRLADTAIVASLKDTALFAFRTNLQLFLDRLAEFRGHHT